MFVEGGMKLLNMKARADDYVIKWKLSLSASRTLDDCQTLRH